MIPWPEFLRNRVAEPVSPSPQCRLAVPSLRSTWVLTLPGNEDFMF